MKKYISITFLIATMLFSLNGYSQKNLTFTVNGVSFEMIFVEGGNFVMGCTAEQSNCNIDERPTHKVTLTDFFMGEFEVTQKLWYAVMGSTLRNQVLLYTYSMGDFFDVRDAGFTPEDYAKVMPLNGQGDDYPIYFINYSECEKFCEILNHLLADQLPEGYKFRIPTEAQWEYAARGGKLSKNYRFSGSDDVNDVGWYDVNCDETTHEVGKKMKNELGIYDMSGNVWEWCRDRYSENYYSSSPSYNPMGPSVVPLKEPEYVLRGGSWNFADFGCRIATRNKEKPVARTLNYGFRLCLEPPPKILNSGFFGYTGNFSVSKLSSGKNLTFKANDVKFDMIFVEGGNFFMGCSSTHCDTIEKPQHQVKLSNYYIGKYEVTQKLWSAVMETSLQQQRDLANSSWGIYGQGDNYPVYYVNYEECILFCEKLNAMLFSQLPEGYKFTLPTEAQWEYAARGGKKSKGYLYSGNNRAGKVAWWENNSGNRVRETGQKSKNELGIFDMSGNVWEWCRDWFEDIYYSYASTTNPQGPLTGINRVVRGGSWNLKEWHSRATTRFFDEPTARSANLGFRIALQPAKDFFDIKSVKNAVNKYSSKSSSANNRNYKIDDLYFEMIFVDGGTFTMGCTSDPNDCFVNEEPTHSVTLSDFYIGKFQVTQQLWAKIMGTTVSEQRNLLDTTLALYGEGDNYPVYFINYKECEEFCEKLNQRLEKQLPEGYKFALPTEAQWEYAARGGKKSKGYIYSGGNDIKKVGWYEDNSGGSGSPTTQRVIYTDEFGQTIKTGTVVLPGKNRDERTQEVGQKNRNELGIYDMSGNVWEWCRDWFDGDYYLYSPTTDPTGPGYGYQHTLRGGSWRSVAKGCRVSCRFAASPNERASNCGLRVALVKVEETK